MLDALLAQLANHEGPVALSLSGITVRDHWPCNRSTSACA